jgi:hypothetical protein
MFNSLLSVIFRCSHRNTTFPITPARNSASAGVTRHGTYVVCLSCGKELDYNWSEMRVGDAIVAPVMARPAESFSALNQ